MRCTLASVAMVIVLAAAARAEVTLFQNGVGPTADYHGCSDTWISDEQWENGGQKGFGNQPTMTFGGPKRSMLIRFELAAIPKDHIIHKAVLRLSDAGYPRPEKTGAFPSSLTAYLAVQPWQENASWSEFERTPGKRTPEGKPNPNWKPAHLWQTAGGDYDAATGIRAVNFDTSAGHIHQLDIAPLLRAWHEGKSPNHGLLLKGLGRGEATSSRWYVPTARPLLIVDHGPRRSRPTGIAVLKGPSKEITLDEIAATADTGKAQGDYAAVCVGQNSRCALRGASTDTYLKEAALRFPGTWGWHDMIRVGGRAGDTSRALLYFDLRDIPHDASIKAAGLVLSLTPYHNEQATRYRYGAFLLRLPESLRLPQSPGWSSAEATLDEARAGKPWPAGGLLTVSGERPLAIGQVAMKEVEVYGHKNKVPGRVEFDLTGAVRAWVSGTAPNCGIVIDNRIEGGAFDFYSSRAWKPKLRPYLEITLSPGIDRKAEPITTRCALPGEDYWVVPMREIHQRFRGKPGVLAQYGDSITITQAFLEPHSYAKSVTAENIAPEVQKEMDVVTAYADRELWRKWKSPEYGNNGAMVSTWLINNIDGWQKKMQPEASVILFGTNDFGKVCPPEYTENMAAAVRRMLQDGTVPMLTTVPPANGRDSMFMDYYAAQMCIARALKIPVIDYYAEIVKRRADDWNGASPKFKANKELTTLISADGVHPSFPQKYRVDWCEEGLSNSGYTLRNYMTLRMYSQVITKVFRENRERPN